MIRHQVRPCEFNLGPTVIRQLIDAAPIDRDRVVLTLFGYTGIRRAELQCLTVIDLDTKRHRIAIRRGKGNKSRLVFYPREEDVVIERYLNGQTKGFLFPGKHGRPVTLRTINNIVARTALLAGITNPNPRYVNVTPHLLRHSFARNWKRANGPMESLRRLLGHASVKTTIDLYGTESIDETDDNYRQLMDVLVTPSQTQP